MTGKIIFLLEERSMMELLQRLLPRLFPGIRFQCVPHEGKQDLEKSIPRKLRAWKEPGVRFIVVRDNDNANCEWVKRNLVDICHQGGRTDTMVRIACQELESWYFGEPGSLARAYDKPNLERIGANARYRNPDTINTPSRLLCRMIPEFQKVSGARKMGEFLQGVGNTSPSFQAFYRGVQSLITDCKEDPPDTNRGVGFGNHQS